jgi:hypothetical protein
MPSSYTDLGLELQAAGENTNTWGAPKLNNALSRVNNLVGGFYAITVTGDYSLTSSNSSTAQVDNTARQAFLKFNGAPSANFTVTAPSVGMGWAFWNNTAKVVPGTTGAGGTVTVDAGDIEPVWSDGSNLKQITFGGLRLKDFIAASVLGATGSLPSVTGNAGKYVYTDGATAYWKQIQSTDIGDFEAAVRQKALIYTLVFGS